MHLQLHSKEQAKKKEKSDGLIHQVLAACARVLHS
jgi:hypothetical protein